MKRKVKDAIKRFMFWIYKTALHFKVNISPAHYYASSVNIRELEKNRDSWIKKSALPGVDTHVDNQIASLKTICLPFQDEYKENEIYKKGVNQAYGPGYGYIEAQAVHAVVRYFKPRQIIEVGSGVSTYCSLQASKMNKQETGAECSITCIEPYPSDKLKSLKEVQVEEKIVQKTDVAFFSRLKKNDLLFIDSSHTVKPGSDVNFLILEVLPLLNPGVIVHFHDIYLPYDYQRNVLHTFLHWSETSLLRAFLINNPKVEIIFSLSMLHYDKKVEMKKVFPEYNPQPDNEGLLGDKQKAFQPLDKHFPSSIYLKIK